jgi:hypothetical protein
METRAEDLARQWVAPFYMQCLHGRFLHSDVLPPALMDTWNRALETVNEAISRELLQTRNWRHRLVGACFAGLKRYTMLTDNIGDLFLVSASPYAGWGYCFALARFGTQLSSHYLTTYLDHYLLEHQREYDQGYALGALRWLDLQQESNVSYSFLLPDGLWDQFVSYRHPASQAQWRALPTVFMQCLRICQQRFEPDGSAYR